MAGRNGILRDATKGIAAMAAAAVIWGLSGMYYKLLDPVPPLEILGHRIFWSGVFFGGVIVLQGHLGQLRAALTHRATLVRLAIASIAIGVNWFGFIYSIHSGHALEASLGYYIFPLVAVGLGYLAFGERFSAVQRSAIGLAVLAVLVLTFGLGRPPWISLALAVSFGAYGLVKKRLRTDPVVSVFAETAFLMAPALAYIVWSRTGQGAADPFGRDLRLTLLLFGAGPLTALPLILMSYAAQRVSYSSLGLVQYLNPTLQFVVAVEVFGEPFTRWHGIAFPMIWAGLVLYAAEGLRQERALRRETIRSETLGTGVR
jgi:chloramphenicol-sensitive protein RarD